MKKIGAIIAVWHLAHTALRGGGQADIIQSQPPADHTHTHITERDFQTIIWRVEREREARKGEVCEQLENAAVIDP